MTPRGAGEAQVYTPERIVQRYGIAAARIPDFIALKGDSADNIAAVPGIGEKTAADLLARFGSLEAILGNLDQLSPARRKSLEAHAASARAARELATLRRDLPLPSDAEPRALVAKRPDRSGMRAVFERFELKRLLTRLDVLEEAIPAR